MARIFVSYNRKSTEFCKRLTDELQKRELDFWVDWEGIPPTVEWMKEIEKGIEEADTFLAIVTPEWITSKVCIDELAIAVKNGKRMIPVVPYDIVWDDVSPALAKYNFIFFTEKFDFNTQLELLFTALNTDYDWLKTHRRLQVKALEWERGDKENGYLLRGADLEEAESQISINANKDPHPTDLQREYVLKSRQSATRQRRIATGILTALVAVMLGIIGLLVRPYVEDAIAKAEARDQSQMIFVPAGQMEFWLGDFSEPVNFNEFNIEYRPVTNHVYGLCVKVGKCPPPIGSTINPENSDGKNSDGPVTWLTIDQAANYCKWIGRRLPSAPEWEYAINFFVQETQKDNHFIISDHWEWTSSYTKIDSQGRDGEWNGQLNTLNIVDWIFLQELGDLSSPDGLVVYTNPSGAFNATGTLSFRCVKLEN